jgi:PAS domain S-box-containing protein
LGGGGRHDEKKDDGKFEPRESGRVPKEEMPNTGPIPRAEVERALAAHSAPTIPGGFAPPGPDQVTAELLTLAATTSPEMSPAQLAKAYLEVLLRLFPGRLFAIRLTAEAGDRPLLVETNSEIREAQQGRITLSREAVQRHFHIEGDLVASGVELTDGYVPVFAEGSAGFDVPLFDRKRVAGVLAVEYPPDVPIPAGDSSILVPFALQLGGVLRSARLLGESTYLRDYLAKILEHASAPIIVIGHKREIRVANRAFAKLLQIEADEILGRDLFTLLPAEEHSRLLPVFIDALRGVPTRNFELRLPRSQGGFARLTINAASILSSGGTVEAVIAIGSDRTEVAELQEQVIQAEKLATLGQLAAGVVHELNNPLTSISVYGDYLHQKLAASGADASDVEKARRIVDASDRILRFTKDLVTYARPAGEAPVLLDAADVVEKALVFCDHVLEERSVVLEKSYDDELPAIVGIAGQLHQVFINLITNACHAVAPGGNIRIGVGASESGGVLIEIVDDGDGIQPEKLQEIFEPFYSTKKEGVGTGLGLSIVKNIVDTHRGEISVESVLGEGTTFVVKLPPGAGE